MHINKFLNLVLTELNDLKAINVLPLNVQHLTSITDYMVIATGNSSRHVRSLVDNLMKHMKEHHISPIGIEGDLNSEWLLIDFGDIVVHVMQAHTREFYQLEKLWSVPQAQLAAIA